MKTKLFMNYPINEIFCSYQGEGFNTGLRAVFIRLSGCNLQCPFCDTDHKENKILNIEQIIDDIQQYDCPNIIITGGEPTIHDLRPLLSALKTLKKWVAIETNGTNDLSNIEDLIDYIAVSPKGQIKLRKADEVRVLSYDLSKEQVLDIGRSISAKHYFLSPLDIDGIFNIIETIKLLSEVNEAKEKEWFLSIQTHKLAGIR